MPRLSMVSHRPFLIGIVVFSFWLGTGAAAVNQPDETLPGFKSTDVLFAGAVDHVSAYSGDTGIAVPLGRSFALGPVTTWQLKAYNTLKVWYIDDNQQCTDTTGGLQNVSQAFILGLPTLGAGWNLSVGYVGTWQGSPLKNQGPYVYISPDGGIHKTDIGGVTFDEPRLRVSCDSQTSCHVEFPEGTTSTFTHLIPDPAPVSGVSPDFTFGNITGVLGLTSWSDAFSNSLMTVTYGANGAPGWGISSIVLHPSTTPATIVFNWKTSSGAASTVTLNGTDWSGSPITATWPVLDSIQFPTITAGNESEKIVFSYAATAYERNNALDSTASFNCTNPDPEQVLAPTLTKIAYNRVTSTGTAAVGSYSMGYDYLTAHGVLDSITLPTGANVGFTLGGVGPYNKCSGWPVAGLETSDLPAGCTAGTAAPALAGNTCRLCQITQASSYVSARKLTIGSTISTTSYTRQNYVPSGYPTQANGAGYLTRVVEVTEPVDGATTRLTRFMFHNPDDGSDPSIGGMELERAVDMGSTLTSPPVRTIVACEQTADADTAALTYACGYLDDSGAVHSFQNEGRVRHAGSVTWYGAKPTGESGGSCGGAPCESTLATTNTWVANAYKYKTTVHFTSGLTNDISRTTITAWNPCNDATRGHWLLDLFTSKSTTDGSGSAPLSVTSGYAFETCKPFVTKTTTGDSNGTLETDYSDDGHGNPATITRWGNPVSAGLTGTQFKDTYTFQSFLPTSQSRNGVNWKSFNTTRDAATGVIKTSLDPNILTTTYTYDGLGRLTSIAPPGGELATTISYDSTTQTTVSRGSGSAGTFERYRYDSAGRLIREIRQMPTGYAFRTHSFDIGGHESFTSEWWPCSALTSDCVTGTGGGTLLESFDIFDRPQRITRADGSSTTIDRTDGPISYSDTCETTTVYNAGRTVAAGPTKTARDLLGRVRSVQEAPATDIVNGMPTQEAPTTTYSYNVLDKLATVSQGSQTRTFTYTAYGFLKSETNPEKGTTTYSSYDALGDLLSKTDGGIAYTNTYDSASRLLLERSGSTTFAMNCYDGSANVPTCPDGVTPNSSGGTHPKGRLTRRVGYNPGISASANVTDDFTYSDATGRLSAKVIALAGSPIGSTLTANESWTYNSLGFIATFTRPGIGATGTASSQTYAYGLPTTLTTAGGTQALTSNVTYAAAGQLSGWKAGPASGTGVVTMITPESSGIARPHQIKAVSGTTTVFDTSVYQYDGDGNIKTMGSDTFGYDARSRLTSSSVQSIPLSYSYDRYGNLMSGLPVGVAVSSSTNRFTASPGVSYDALGDLMAFGGATYGYDALGRQTSYTSGATSEKYVYDGGNERVARVSTAGTTWYATFRDETNQLAAEYTITPTAYTKTKDYFHLGNLLLSTYASGFYTFYTSDHLGTPRYASNVSGGFVESHNYQPYGQEIGGTFGVEPLKFAKMERDQTSTNDFDHARFSLTGTGRFASVDKQSGYAENPQSWNRYSYVGTNPIRYVDPDGKERILTEAQLHWSAAQAAKNEALNATVSRAVSAALHYTAVRDAFQGWSTEPPSERLMAIAVAAIAAVDVGANILEPEKAAIEQVATKAAGAIVLGHFPGNREVAERIGAEFLNVADWTWGKNRAWLRDAIRAGKDIFLSVSPSKVRAGSWTEKELQYLAKRGWEFVYDTSVGLWKAVKK